MADRNYTVQLNFNASILVDVTADDNDPMVEGKVLEMARDIAEDADINEFTIGSERESQIIRRE